MLDNPPVELRFRDAENLRDHPSVGLVDSDEIVGLRDWPDTGRFDMCFRVGEYCGGRDGRGGSGKGGRGF